MKRVAWVLFILLIVLHQDFWWWYTEKPLVLGFIPIGLAHHVALSLGAGVLAFLLVRYAWPAEVDEVDDTAPSKPGGHG